jgi:hypothetical protein
LKIFLGGIGDLQQQNLKKTGLVEAVSLILSKNLYFQMGQP